MNKITAIYGGAFNPPTIGHESLVTNLLIQKQVDKIIFCPDGTRWDKNYGVPKEQREEIIKIFFDEMRAKGLNIEADYHFLSENRDTYTIEVTKYFESLYDFPVWHIFGSDTIRSMAKWLGNENSYIETKINKIFINRPGYIVTKEDLKKMQNYLLIDMFLPIISSTIVRERLKTKQSITSLLTPGVEKFINENNINY